MPKYYYVEYRDESDTPVVCGVSVRGMLTPLFDAKCFNSKSYEERKGLTAHVCEDRSYA